MENNENKCLYIVKTEVYHKETISKNDIETTILYVGTSREEAERIIRDASTQIELLVQSYNDIIGNNDEPFLVYNTSIDEYNIDDSGNVYYMFELLMGKYEEDSKIYILPNIGVLNEEHYRMVEKNRKTNIGTVHIGNMAFNKIQDCVDKNRIEYEYTDTFGKMYIHDRPLGITFIGKSVYAISSMMKKVLDNEALFDEPFFGTKVFAKDKEDIKNTIKQFIKNV